MPVDEDDGLLTAESNSDSGTKSVRIRKAAEGKDIFIEVWDLEQGGFVSSLKVNEKMTKLYNDAVFGGISWSTDENKICFVAEVPEIAKYNNPWD
jgi:hypothetical protein